MKKSDIHYDHLGHKTTPVDEEHGGHDMKADNEEGVITAGGHCKFDVDLESNIIAELIDTWAADNLSDASLEQYQEVLAKDGQEKAIYSGLLNEIIINILKQEIELCEAKLDDSPENV